MSRGFQSNSSKNDRNKVPRTFDAEKVAPTDVLQKVIELHSKGLLENPLDSYRKLYESGLDDCRLFVNLAILEFNSGNIEDAFSLLNKSIAIDSRNAFIYLLLGTIARRLGNPDLSIQYLQKSLRLSPNNFDALLVISLSYFECDRFEEALKACHDACLINSQSSELYANLSMVYLALGRVEDSKIAAEESIRLNPRLPEAYLNLGNALHVQNEWSKAIEFHLKALDLRQDFSQALSGVGNAYRALGEMELAQKYFEDAIRSNPNDFQAYSNLAITKRDQGDLGSALNYCLKAIEINKNSASVFINLGVIYYERGDLVLSEKAYRRAIEIDPGNAEAQFSLATVILSQGDYSQGFGRYEWRFAHNAKDPILQEIDGMTRWHGPERGHCLPEIYLLHEQGLGDSIQFIRFAPLLKKYAKMVYFVCPEPLLNLFAASELVDQVVLMSTGLHNRSKDAESLPLMSIPYKLGIESTQCLDRVPYLKVNQARKDFWIQKVNQDKADNDYSFLVALNWQGNPDVEKEKMRGRSIPLQMLSPLASIPGVRFVSIQKGYGSEQLSGCSFRDKFVGFQSEVEELWDFLEIAALLSSCDLVISSDTSAAHLAGAIGAPLWIPLKKVAEWRWGVQGTTTPWYPTATLFRQTTGGDWSGPVEQMRTALEQEIMNTL